MKYAALAVLLMAAPALAQDRAAEIDFENARREAPKIAQRHAALAKTWMMMSGVVDGASAAVLDYINSQGIGVSFGAQDKLVITTHDNGKTLITLSEDLPALPWVYGPLIAREVAAMMYADMPACAERAYMRRATAGRVWLELGGQPNRLPVVATLQKYVEVRVPAISDEIEPWIHNGAEKALSIIGRMENLPSIPDLFEKANDKGERAALDAANKRFVSFLCDEFEIRNPSRLKLCK